MENPGFMEPEIYFTLDGQGAGACFDCKIVDIAPLWGCFVKSGKAPEDAERYFQNVDYMADATEPKVATLCTMCSHGNTRD